MRGFERISKEKENVDIIIPKRSTSGSAGYDFFAPYDISIDPNQDFPVKTGIKSYMMKDECLFLYPRSSIGIKYGIMLKNTVGVVDSDYYGNPSNEGEIIICLHNSSNEQFFLKKGERFCQGVFKKVLLADDDSSDQEREGGFGSTGN